MRAKRFVLSILCLALHVAPARAQDAPTRDQLRDIEQSLQEMQERREAVGAEAQALADELGTLQQNAVAAAASVRAQERTLKQLRGEEAALARREAETRAALAARQAEIAAMTTALLRLAREPMEPLLLDPSPTIDRARAGILLDRATADLLARSDALRGELEALAGLAAELAAKRQAVETSGKTLAAERAALDGLLGERRALYRAREGERRALEAQAASLAREAETLRDLIERVEAEQKRLAQFTPPPKPRMAARPPPRPDGAPAPLAGAVLSVFPVEGELMTRFGGPDKAGLTARGVVWKAAPGATVLAPRDGIVRFAGRFRNQGQILILAHGGEYHSLLGGLADVSAAVGETVLAGEPVGTVADTGGGDGEVYLELRRNGRPLDPLSAPAAARN